MRTLKVISPCWISAQKCICVWICACVRARVCVCVCVCVWWFESQTRMDSEVRVGIGSIYCKGVAEWTWRGFRRIRRDAEGRGYAFLPRRGEIHQFYDSLSLSRFIRPSQWIIIGKKVFILAARYALVPPRGKIHRSSSLRRGAAVLKTTIF